MQEVITGFPGAANLFHFSRAKALFEPFKRASIASEIHALIACPVTVVELKPDSAKMSRTFGTAMEAMIACGCREMNKRLASFLKELTTAQSSECSPLLPRHVKGR